MNSNTDTMQPRLEKIIRRQRRYMTEDIAITILFAAMYAVFTTTFF